ncbi:class C beta-lactamase [Stenotrophomonas rhizophila]|uniref:class C beta-lactamase n=1 Tax=Stenotrophomonas rhizophila TaxID=216778 RepID=UPI001E3F0DC7|nr:class C beta-lactamase [Stenotrophomonas rhizophila]MCC7634831.1 beta-lactamase [Stenotrophomonas rhizophila]MCC7664496.1 beta-lactamase [Stenotrophomonas rhizophila]
MSSPLRNLLLASALLASAAPAAHAAQTQPVALDPAFVDGAAAAFMQRYHVPGMVIGISHNGQQRFYSYGVASKATKAPVTPNTLFELGSISKTFTATLSTYAQARGALSLQDPVGKYLPDLAGHPIGSVPLWQLGTHSGGGFPLQFPDAVKTDADAMRYYRQWTPSYPGGEQRSYANPSIALLGVVAARALDQSFERAMQGTLYPKLGLTSSWLRVPQKQRRGYAQGYNAADVAVRLNPGPLAQEAYGMRSSARDLLHFVELNIAPATGDAALDKALRDTQLGRFELGPMTQALVWEQYRYPLALEALLQGNSDQMAYHDNPTTPIATSLLPQQDWLYNKTGGTGGFAGYVAFIPSRQVGIVILTNKSHPNEGRVRLAYALLEALEKAP